METIYTKIIREIIKQQEQIVGSLAWSEAKKIKGIIVKNEQLISVTEENEKTLNALVEQYKGLFGPASVAVCKDALKKFTKEIDIISLPDILK